MRRHLQFTAAAAFLGLGLSTLAACGSSQSTTKDAAGAGSSSTAATASTAAAAMSGPNPYAYLPKVPAFTLTSTTVRAGHPLPTAQLSGIFGVPGGKDISPQLAWSGFPKTTKSFVVSMYDPEAPTGSGFWHWTLVDIPSSTTSLPQDAGTLHSTTLPAGAFDLNADSGMARYIGGAPPAGSGVHDYYITVTALDVAKISGITAATSPALLNFTIDGDTVARATLVCPTPAAP